MLKIDKIVCKTPKQDLIYLVTMDGYTQSYGAEIYAVGAYTKESAAKKKVDAIAKKGGYAKITPLLVDKSLTVKGDPLQGFITESYLGGHIE